MSIEIPFNENKFQYSFFPASLNGVTDEATLRASVDRINYASSNFGEGKGGRIVVALIVSLVLFIVGWVLFGVGLGIDNLGMLIAGIASVLVSIVVGVTTVAVYHGLWSNAIQAAVDAENKRFRESNIQLAFKYDETTQYRNSWGGRSDFPETFRKLIIVSPDQIGKPIKQINHQPTSQPASQTMADTSPAHEHSIEIADHSITRA